MSPVIRSTSGLPAVAYCELPLSRSSALVAGGVGVGVGVGVLGVGVGVFVGVGVGVRGVGVGVAVGVAVGACFLAAFGGFWLVCKLIIPPVVISNPTKNDNPQ